MAAGAGGGGRSYEKDGWADEGRGSAGLLIIGRGVGIDWVLPIVVRVSSKRELRIDHV